MIKMISEILDPQIEKVNLNKKKIRLNNQTKLNQEYIESYRKLETVNVFINHECFLLRETIENMLVQLDTLKHENYNLSVQINETKSIRLPITSSNKISTMPSENCNITKRLQAHSHINLFRKKFNKSNIDYVQID